MPPGHDRDGRSDGWGVGKSDGKRVGDRDGRSDGWGDGKSDGKRVGAGVVGAGVGKSVG